MPCYDTQGASKAEPTVLALGVDGGFRTDEQKYDVIKTHRLVALKAGSAEGFSVSYPDEVRAGLGLLLYFFLLETAAPAPAA